jgi:chromosome segregation ATPase
MVEPIMFFGIGFLVASLIGLIIIPLVHGRAVRLTMRRLEAATPLSMAEIQADKDQLRAEFAMSTRRLEMSVEQLKAKTTSQFAELGKKTDAINRLKVELGEKNSVIFALESRERMLKDQLHTTEEELAVKTNGLHDAQRALADKQAELKKITFEFTDKSVLADSQRVEMAALNTQIDALKTHVSDHQREVRETQERLERERSDAAAVGQELAQERGKAGSLGDRVVELQRQLTAQTNEAESLARRVQEVEQRLADQGRLLAERELERDQLRATIALATQKETELRAELAARDDRISAATANLRNEKAMVDKQLERVQEENIGLRAEIAKIKREAEGAWESERMESALLRERINDIAAEVARLAVALEGPGSPIETMLTEGTAPPLVAGNGAGAASAAASDNGNTEGGAQPKGNLADRIRALQTRASRIQSIS